MLNKWAFHPHNTSIFHDVKSMGLTSMNVTHIHANNEHARPARVNGGCPICVNGHYWFHDTFFPSGSFKNDEPVERRWDITSALRSCNTVRSKPELHAAGEGDCRGTPRYFESARPRFWRLRRDSAWSAWFVWKNAALVYVTLNVSTCRSFII